MKVLMVIDSLVRGGRERRLLALLRGLAPCPGVQCEVVLFSNRVEYPEIFELGVPVHIIDRKPAKDPRAFLRLVRLCRRVRPDILHSWAMMSSVYALAPKLLLGLKFINAGIADAPLHMSFFYENNFRGRLTFPFSDVVLANSQAGLRAYRAPAAKSEFIHNGFAFQRLQNLEPPAEVRRRLGVTTTRVIGMVGGFHDRKDFDGFVSGGCQLLAQHPDLTCVAVGDGPHRQHCQALVPDGLRGRFLFPGQQTDVEAIMNIFDVGVLLTNAEVHQEGISNSILEYMALAKPVVASRGGGTDEIVVDGQTGFLVPPLQPEAFAAATARLLTNPDLAHQMGTAGRQRVEQDFSIEKMVERFLQLYRRLLSDG